jgi:hypothetical protein
LIKISNIKNAENYTVVYQIHKDGISTPLSYAQLTEAWTDNYYYFSTINFKKSGKYTISFLVEGNTNAGSIKPLIFPVYVEAKSIKCGLSDALDRLIANSYLDLTNRQIINNRRDLLQFIRLSTSYPDDMNILLACKVLLIKLFLALPQGSLSAEIALHYLTLDEAPYEILSTHLLEPSGWNYILEQSWKAAVMNAVSPSALMECVLLLEFYLNKSWMMNPQSKLLNSLPNAHFAIRATTYSSVALRIYSLDRALAYDKVQTAPREKRGNSSSTATSHQYEGYYEEQPVARSSRYLRNKAEVEESTGYTRVKRGAAAAATERLKSYGSVSPVRMERQDSNESYYKGEEEDDEDDEDAVPDEEDEDDEDDENGEGSDSDENKSSRLTNWKCTSCSIKNEARARSCDACGARKPVAGTYKDKNSKKRKASKPRRGAKSKHSRRNLSDESEDEAEEDDSEDENRRRPRRTSRAKAPSMMIRRSGRNRTTRKYKDPDSDEEEENNSYQEESDESEKAADDDDEPNVQEDDEDENSDNGSEASSAKDEQENEETFEELAERRIEEITETISELKTNQSPSFDFNIRCLSILRKFLGDFRTEVFWEPVNLDLETDYQ